MELKLLPGEYSVYQFRPGSEIPEWVRSSGFYSFTVTTEEISVVSLTVKDHAGDFKAEHGWSIIQIAGELDFSLIGIISELTSVLAGSLIPVFVISTYNTDFILIKTVSLDKAIAALEARGYVISA